MSLVLTVEEIANLTGRERPKAQAKVLRGLGVPFRVHPVDRTVIVSRAAVEAALSGRSEEVSSRPPELYEVNLEGIRRHGKATTAQ